MWERMKERNEYRHTDQRHVRGHGNRTGDHARRLVGVLVRSVPDVRAGVQASSEKHPDIRFGKVDTEDQPGLSAAARITSIPTLMAFRDGVLVFSQAGALPAASLEKLIQAVRDLDMDEVRGDIAAQQKS